MQSPLLSIISILAPSLMFSRSSSNCLALTLPSLRLPTMSLTRSYLSWSKHTTSYCFVILALSVYGQSHNQEFCLFLRYTGANNVGGYFTFALFYSIPPVHTSFGSDPRGVTCHVCNCVYHGCLLFYLKHSA